MQSFTPAQWARIVARLNDITARIADLEHEMGVTASAPAPLRASSPAA
jgi:hypothetical protein